MAEHPFVNDGYERAYQAAEPEIRAAVVAEYSEQLAVAGFWQRFWLWREIQREVRVRVEKVAPPDALY